MLKKDNKLLKNKDFECVLKYGRSVPSHFFLLKYGKNTSLINRFGFVISLNVSKKAVERNLLKRRMREIIRCHPELLAGGFDVVFLIRKQSLSLDFNKLEGEVLKTLKNIIK